ncbi:unnamed protein product [Cyprideis torosa]|uniref:Uncharacterized protein n=1 Tax=Cyprideis torosa TaxID=163714 RepID=A0A7R8WMJ7_9CRUS|nr:unnamed protein product [Cyprideis torosa]CAG0898519.1 unnamed protein product [Cyprideis torosa]
MFIASLLLCGTLARAFPQLPLDSNTSKNGSLESSDGMRIINGDDARAGWFPHQVALLTSSNVFFCGGSIISREWVVTAAHCVEKGYAAKIRAGTINRSSGGTVHQVVETIWERNLPWEIHDYAVIRVSPPFTFGAYVQPIPLGYGNPTGLTCYASGWGQYETANQNLPTILQYIQVYARPENECSAHRINYVTQTQVCTSTQGNVCYGDSGGPLTCYKNGIGQLYGIVSTGYPDCSWAGYHPSIWADAASDYGLSTFVSHKALVDARRNNLPLVPQSAKAMRVSVASSHGFNSLAAMAEQGSTRHTILSLLSVKLVSAEGDSLWICKGVPCGLARVFPVD